MIKKGNNMTENREKVLEIINCIAEYLERPENWRRLKDCWIINGRSDDLRQLLKEALERDE